MDIKDCQQALFTMGLTNSSTVSLNAQRQQTVGQKQITKMVTGQNVINTRSNGRSKNTISLNASANTKMSASQGISMSASGPSQQSSQRTNLTSCFASSNGQQGLSYNPVNMMAGSSSNTSGWGKIKSFGNSFVSSSNGQKLSDMRNASNMKMSAQSSDGQTARDSVDFQIKSFPNQPVDFQKDDYFAPGGSKFSRPSKSMGVSRSSKKTVLMALPEGAEGDWGSVDRNYVIGGNWKSNGDFDFANTFTKDVLNKATFDPSKVEVVVAPTDLHLNTVKECLAEGNVHASAQDVSQYGRGAYTGNITADQLTDAGIKWTLTGHSERRTLFHETDSDVALKTKVALENGLNVMLCIGELLEERESGKTGEVNARQLQAVVDQITESQWGNVVIAYEPVWAIGTGKVATPQQAQDTHAEIRDWLAGAVSPAVAGATRILYGGSVNGANCADLITNPDIDGFLVGGASLKPEFADIIQAADDHKKA